MQFRDIYVTAGIRYTFDNKNNIFVEFKMAISRLKHQPDERNFVRLPIQGAY